MTSNARDPFKDAKAVVGKALKDITSADIEHYLGYMKDGELMAVLDLIERAEVKLRWGR